MPVTPSAKQRKRKARAKRTARGRNTRLIELRLNAGLSREDLERKTGVSRETIRLAELGFTPSRPHQQFEIAKVFGLLPLDIWPLEDQTVAA